MRKNEVSLKCQRTIIWKNRENVGVIREKWVVKMILETKRLKLIPLKLDQLEESLIDKEKMEKESGLTSDERSLDDLMQRVYKIKIDKIKVNPEDYLYYTYWQIVAKNSNQIMGTIGYKGIPNSSGEIEVGYGLHPNHRGLGYMTEALKKMVKWAFDDVKQEVQAVIGRTTKENSASQKVIERVNMTKYDEDVEYIWFRVDKR